MSSACWFIPVEPMKFLSLFLFTIFWLDHFTEEVISKASFQKGYFKLVLEVSYVSKAHLWPHFVMFFGVVGKFDNCVQYLLVSLLLQDEPKKM